MRYSNNFLTLLLLICVACQLERAGPFKFGFRLARPFVSRNLDTIEDDHEERAVGRNFLLLFRGGDGGNSNRNRPKGRHPKSKKRRSSSTKALKRTRPGRTKSTQQSKRSKKSKSGSYKGKRSNSKVLKRTRRSSSRTTNNEESSHPRHEEEIPISSRTNGPPKRRKLKKSHTKGKPKTRSKLKGRGPKFVSHSPQLEGEGEDSTREFVLSGKTTTTTTTTPTPPVIKKRRSSRSDKARKKKKKKRRKRQTSFTAGDDDKGGTTTTTSSTTTSSSSSEYAEPTVQKPKKRKKKRRKSRKGSSSSASNANKRLTPTKDEIPPLSGGREPDTMDESSVVDVVVVEGTQEEKEEKDEERLPSTKEGPRKKTRKRRKRKKSLKTQTTTGTETEPIETDEGPGDTAAAAATTISVVEEEETVGATSIEDAAPTTTDQNDQKGHDATSQSSNLTTAIDTRLGTTVEADKKEDDVSVDSPKVDEEGDTMGSMQTAIEQETPSSEIQQSEEEEEEEARQSVVVDSNTGETNDFSSAKPVTEEVAEIKESALNFSFEKGTTEDCKVDEATPEGTETFSAMSQGEEAAGRRTPETSAEEESEEEKEAKESAIKSSKEEDSTEDEEEDEDVETTETEKFATGTNIEEDSNAKEVDPTVSASSEEEEEAMDVVEQTAGGTVADEESVETSSLDDAQAAELVAEKVVGSAPIKQDRRGEPVGSEVLSPDSSIDKPGMADKIIPETGDDPAPELVEDSSTSDELDIPIHVDEVEVTIHVDKEEKVSVRLGNDHPEDLRTTTSGNSSATRPPPPQHDAHQEEHAEGETENAALPGSQTTTTVSDATTHRSALADGATPAAFVSVDKTSTAERMDTEDYSEKTGATSATGSPSILRENVVNQQSAKENDGKRIEMQQNQSQRTNSTHLADIHDSSEEDEDEDESDEDSDNDNDTAETSTSISPSKQNLGFNGGSTESPGSRSNESFTSSRTSKGQGKDATDADAKSSSGNSNNSMKKKVSLEPETHPSDMKVSVVTWNLAESSPAEADATFFRQLRGSDLVLISGQECENIKPRRTEGHRSREFRRLMIKMLGKKYVPLGLHMLGGIQFGLFCRRSFLAKIEFVSIADVTCGIGNVFHNKGAIGAFVQVKASKGSTGGEEKRRAKSLKMLFVTAHLAAHVKNTEARDADFWRVVQELESQAPPRFLRPNPAASDGVDGRRRRRESGGSGSYLLDSMDRVFFCGDLNYRINLPREEAEYAVLQMQKNPKDADRLREQLLRHDQLLATMAEGNAFTGLCEGRISFLPTFKFDKGTDEYDTSHKQRIPAWTDRIVFKPSGTRILRYESVPDALHSDHRPVFASFQVSTQGSELEPARKRKRSRRRSLDDSIY